jgi:hypothetical protein
MTMLFLRLSFLVIVATSATAQLTYSQTPSSESPCPTISVSCPSENGSTLMFGARVSGSWSNLTFKWTVSNGKIVSGQGTSSVTIDVRGFEGQSVTATVEVGGLPDKTCLNVASCTLAVCGLRVPRKIDEYGNLSLKEERARFDNFAAQLQTNPQTPTPKRRKLGHRARQNRYSMKHSSQSP